MYASSRLSQALGGIPVITYAMVLLTKQKPVLIATDVPRAMCDVWAAYSEFNLCIELLTL